MTRTLSLSIALALGTLLALGGCVAVDTTVPSTTVGATPTQSIDLAMSAPQARFDDTPITAARPLPPSLTADY